VVKSSVGSNFVGKFAQLGSFRRPSEELERASQHWTDTGVPSANKNNIARNPANKDEFRLVVHNYENISKKYANFLRSERESQQEKWLVVSNDVLSASEPGTVFGISQFVTNARKGAQDPFFLVKVDDLRARPLVDFPEAVLTVAMVRFEHTDVVASEPWLRGTRVLRLPKPDLRTLQLHEETVYAPVRAIRFAVPKTARLLVADCSTAASSSSEAIPQSSSPCWRIGRKDWGIWSMMSLVFAFSLGLFYKCRPYENKPGSRETSLCVYHLRWEFICEGLTRWFRKHKQVETRDLADDDSSSDEEGDEGSDQSARDLPPIDKLVQQPMELRRALVCFQAEGSSKAECIEGTCSSCKGFKLVRAVFGSTGVLPDDCLVETDIEDNGDDEASMTMGDGRNSDDDCDGGGADGDDGDGDDDDADDAPPDDDDERAKDPRYIQYDKWVQIKYRTAGGVEKAKYDFRTVTVTLYEFWETFVFSSILFAATTNLQKPVTLSIETW